MAWNQPGGGDQDPWKKPDKNNKDPLESLENLFKRGTGGGGETGGIAIVVLIAFALFLAYSSIDLIDEGEQGALLTLGKFTEVQGPGLSIHLPAPIARLEIRNTDEFKATTIQMEMLTKDKSIVEVDLTAQFNTQDLAAYLFEVKDPEGTLSDSLETATREVIARYGMDEIITTGRTEIAGQVKQILQEILNNYKTGLIVKSVNMRAATYPPEVQDAVSDVTRAKEDEKRYINQAEAYRNSVIPKARGEAARKVEEAKAYKAHVTAAATGEAMRFTQLLKEYAAAPEVTRERLYLETIEQVLSSGKKVMIDANSGQNMMLLNMNPDGQTNNSTATTVAPVISQQNQQDSQNSIRQRAKDTIQNMRDRNYFRGGSN